MLALEQKLATTDDVVATLREADRLIASAAVAMSTIPADRDMPVEFTLRLDARHTRWAANELSVVSDTLRRMPALRSAILEQAVSSQCRAIVRAIRDLRVDDHLSVDGLIERRAEALAQAEPDRLVMEIEDLCARLRVDIATRREERAIETSFLVLRPELTGGGALYGEADPERFASIVEALDTYAEGPVASDDDDPTSRARQHMDALVNIFEASLAGGRSPTRPRPRLLATVDAEGAQLLWNLPGKPPRLSSLATEVLLCDAEVIPIAFEGPNPVAVGDARQTIPGKARTAVIARDRGCRFPGCSAPAAWSDVHHIKWRSEGGTNEVDNLILLCRRCHRRVHGRGWRITLEQDGSADFRLRGRRYVSPPVVQAPLRE